MSWEIFDKFYNAHWFLTGYSCRNFSELLRAGGSNRISKFIGVMKNDVNEMIFDAKEFDLAGTYYANKLVNDHRWRSTMYQRHHRDLAQYFSAAKRLRTLQFSEMTDKQIVAEVKKITLLQEKVRVLGVMLNGLVLDGRGHLSGKIKSQLSQQIDRETLEQHWPMLTQVTRLSMRQKKDIAIAKLAAEAKRFSPAKIKSKLEKIYRQYCWLDYMYYGPPASLDAFWVEFREAKRHNKNLKLKEDLLLLAKKQKTLIKKLKFNADARRLVWLSQQVLWQKAWRKDVEYHGFYSYETWLKEVAKRKNIKDWRDILYLLPWEAENFILKNQPASTVLKQRRNFSILEVLSPQKTRMLVGQKAINYYKKLKLNKNFSGQTTAQGQCAYPGKVSGIVRLVFVPKDMMKMHSGDILVSQATSPDLISAMKKAAAIVTNTGGLICHAAITSRELKIPCIVGTTNATEIFKDGDRVEVDANKGIVRKI